MLHTFVIKGFFFLNCYASQFSVAKLSIVRMRIFLYISLIKLVEHFQDLGLRFSWMVHYIGFVVKVYCHLKKSLKTPSWCFLAPQRTQCCPASWLTGWASLCLWPATTVQLRRRQLRLQLQQLCRRPHWSSCGRSWSLESHRRRKWCSWQRSSRG